MAEINLLSISHGLYCGGFLIGIGTWLVHVDPGSTFHLNSILETKYSLGIVNFKSNFLHLCMCGQASTILQKCPTVDLPPRGK